MVHFLVLTTLAVSSAVAAPTPVEWQADYGKALAATRTDDRPLLVVLDDPSNPSSTVEDAQLKTEGLTSYRLCRIDAGTEYGQKVAKVFNADQFPFTAIIDKTGSVVLHKKQGRSTDAEWNATLSSYQAGERSLPVAYTTAYRGETIVSESTLGSVVSENVVVSENAIVGDNANVIESPSYSSGGTFSFPTASPSVVSPSYCPSCQRNAQRGY